MTHRLLLKGPIPGKKNNRGIGPGGRVYIREEDSAMIADLMWQAREQWTGRDPLRLCQEFLPFCEHCGASTPMVSAAFFVPNGRADLDNKWTTVQDVLVKGGVLKNDSIHQLPGPIKITAYVAGDEEERVEIGIYEHRGLNG